MEKEIKHLETALDELYKSNDATMAAYSTLNFAIGQVKNCDISVVNARFATEDELRSFIQMHLPIAVKATRQSKTSFISPYTSANARHIIIDTLTKAFLNGR